jgi:hypothetical protein
MINQRRSLLRTEEGSDVITKLLDYYTKVFDDEDSFSDIADEMDAALGLYLRYKPEFDDEN